MAAAAVIGAMLVTCAQERPRVIASKAAGGILISDLHAGSTPWVLPVTDRTAFFLVSDPQVALTALLHNIKHNQVSHWHNVLVHVRGHSVHRVGWDQHSQIHDLDKGFWQSPLHFRFMDKLDVSAALEVDDCLRAGTLGKRGGHAAASHQVDQRHFGPDFDIAVLAEVLPKPTSRYSPPSFQDAAVRRQAARRKSCRP